LDSANPFSSLRADEFALELKFYIGLLGLGPYIQVQVRSPERCIIHIVKQGTTETSDAAGNLGDNDQCVVGAPHRPVLAKMLQQLFL
jgi:hypothetical protein